MMQQIISDAVFEEAYQWLCKSREEHPPNSDVWDFRFYWQEIKPRLQEDLRSGRYRVDPVRRFRKGGECFELWSSQDALVLKAITLVLTEELRPVLSDACTHLAGNGGSKAAIRAVEAQLPNYEFAIRTDVKKYYASIDHEILTGILQETVKEVAVRRLLQQFLRRTIDDGGDYETVTKGIPLGSPLSPLLGALTPKSAKRPGRKNGESGCILRSLHGRLGNPSPKPLEIEKCDKAGQAFL